MDLVPTDVSELSVYQKCTRYAVFVYIHHLISLILLPLSETSRISNSKQSNFYQLSAA